MYTMNHTAHTNLENAHSTAESDILTTVKSRLMDMHGPQIAELATKTKVSANTIYNVRSDTRGGFKYETIMTIARALGLKISVH